MTYQPERDVAVAAVIKACRLCESVRASLVSAGTLSKKDKSPVTVADFGAQAVITAELHAAFDTVPLVAEEDAAVLRTEAGAALKSKVVEHVQRVVPDLGEERIVAAIDAGAYGGGAQGRHWTLDPIDGTKGFLRGDQYAIALALIEDGCIVLGVLGCPRLPVDARRPDGPAGCVFVAVQGAGAAMRAIDDEAETPIRVTDVADPSRASFCESVESAHTAHGDAARIAAVLGVAVPPFRIDSQCKYAAIARGDSSIYLRLPTRADYQERIWDHAAGCIVVHEAGGRVTDVRGRPLDFSVGRTLRNNSGVVATNGKLHDPVIHAVQQVLGTS
jgi:3'(2'), 5'-bisphosphate nucleotidase